MRCKNCNWENPTGRTKCEKCNAPLNGSMIDTGKDLHGTVSDEEVVLCSCGYPMRPDEVKCPNCGKTVCEDVDAGEVSDIHNSVNPWARPKKKQKPEKDSEITFTPLPREDEETFDPIRYEGNTIILNRDNTEKDNETITSREQALLTREGDNWYIEDRSEFKTTMIRIRQKTQIVDGDVVAMGDRLFVINIK